MQLEFRAPRDDADLAGMARCDAAAFGFTPKEDPVERIKRTGFLELDRVLLGFDGDQVVGTSGLLSMQLTLPGPAMVANAGVTWVSVLPTHRRKGVLTTMMAGLLDRAAERGEPVATLLASESVIYGRFGFGLATTSATYTIERRHAALARPVVVPGRFRLVDKDESEKLLPDLFDRYRTQTPGEVSRTDGWWRMVFEDREEDREGMTARFVVVHETLDGEVDGYATYRYKEKWDEVPAHKLAITELVAFDPAVRLALLQFLFDLDLVGDIQLGWFPVEEPVRWALRDARRLKCTGMSDHLWVRVLDVPATLTARGYRVEGRVAIDLRDEFRPATSGIYVIDGGPDGATCERDSAVSADLTLSAADLGAVSVGGVRFATLAAAGRVKELVPGAIAKADLMFSTETLPYCSTDF